MNKIGIYDMAGICTLGNDLQSISDHLLNMSDKNYLVEYRNLFSGKNTLIGETNFNLPKIPSEFDYLKSRNNQLLLYLSLQLISSIDKLKTKFSPNRIGVVIGTSTSGILEGEEAFKLANGKPPLKNFKYSQQEISSGSEFLANYLGLNGPRYTVSTACTSGSRAIMEGVDLLNSNICDAVLVGGSDSICELTLNGFDSLQALSSAKTNPFSKNRQGINIGEGGALFLLSRIDLPLKILGIGGSCDGYHVSAPHPMGEGAEKALMRAMDSSNLSKSEIGYVNLHGTGTDKNDEAESHMMSRFFNSYDVLCSSTKPLTGHTLGASGALEMLFSCLIASSRFNPTNKLPVHNWDNQYDDKLPKLNLVSETDVLKSRIIMSNNFAFGGNNTSIIIGESH